MTRRMDVFQLVLHRVAQVVERVVPVPAHLTRPLPPLFSGLDSRHLLLLPDRAGFLLVAYVLPVH